MVNPWFLVLGILAVSSPVEISAVDPGPRILPVDPGPLVLATDQIRPYWPTEEDE